MAYPHVNADEILNWFTYHAPTGDQAHRYEKIRKEAYRLACVINDTCPDSQEKWQAIFQLRDVTMWANASIACNPAEDLMEESVLPGVH